MAKKAAKTRRKKAEKGKQKKRGSSVKCDQDSKRILERRKIVMALRCEGLSYREICRRLKSDHGINACPATITKDLRAEFQELSQEVHEQADALRDIELRRIDELWAAHYPKARAGDEDATELCLKLVDRRVKLLGLNKPEQRDLRVTAGSVAEAMEAFAEEAEG
jgi:predicted transglutaminase-like cysteine proteinase